tara:strand:+ start:231 stop:353 length:123 start_codon:yes stop_codon:yes gene_type:complete
MIGMRVMVKAVVALIAMLNLEEHIIRDAIKNAVVFAKLKS